MLKFLPSAIAILSVVSTCIWWRLNLSSVLSICSPCFVFFSLRDIVIVFYRRPAYTKSKGKKKSSIFWSWLSTSHYILLHHVINMRLSQSCVRKIVRKHFRYERKKKMTRQLPGSWTTDCIRASSHLAMRSSALSAWASNVLKMCEITNVSYLRKKKNDLNMLLQCRRTFLFVFKHVLQLVARAAVLYAVANYHCSSRIC